LFRFARHQGGSRGYHSERRFPAVRRGLGNDDEPTEPPSHQSAPELIHPQKGVSICLRVWAGVSGLVHGAQGRVVPIATTIMNWLFGCRHRELSRAFTAENETYKVCLKCGARLRYSWQTMSLVREGSKPKGPAASAPLHTSEVQKRRVSGKR
jgi:hypothetical protein